jgi:hypothetical protein
MGREEAGFPPTTVKPAPEIVAEPMFTVAVPVFVRLRLCVELLPTATLPKVRLVALAERTPEPGDCDCPPGLVYPAQLERPTTAIMAARGARKAKSLRLNGRPVSVGKAGSKTATSRLGGCVFMTRSV